MSCFYLPYVIPELRELFEVPRIKCFRFHGFNDYPSLELASAEHETTFNGRVLTNKIFCEHEVIRFAARLEVE